jgi:magnesium transporter
MRRRQKRLPIVRPGITGAAPGVLTAPEGAGPSRLSAMAYSPDELVEIEDLSLDDLPDLQSRFPVVWLNLVGLAGVDLLERLGEIFSLHRLALEDSLNLPQRPKFEDYIDHQYMVARMPMSQTILETEQLSFFMGEGYVLTIQETAGDCFGGIRERIRAGRPRIRQGGSGYLAYAIFDALIDSYFPLLESAGQRLEDLELELLSAENRKPGSQLHDLSHALVTLRRYVGPLRDALAVMMREENSYFDETTRLHLRDCQDHARHAFDLIESYREMTTGLMNLHLSLLSQRMNEVMKVLTIIATIFIPLSFVAGLYGMNFDPGVSRWNMPELGWAYGYPAALVVMLTAAGGMILWFRKKGWFR